MSGPNDFRGKFNQIFKVDNPYNIKTVSEIERKKGMHLNLFYDAGTTTIPQLYNNSLKRKIKKLIPHAKILQKISAN